MTYLLDINVLVALFDPVHVHHDSAHAWYASVGKVSWATCPLTENGFVRVVSNPSYPTISATAADAGNRLQVFCQAPEHIFWSDDISLIDPAKLDLTQLVGHQQITDCYLVALAAKNGGQLATFDRRIPVAALVDCSGDPVVLIPAN